MWAELFNLFPGVRCSHDFSVFPVLKSSPDERGALSGLDMLKLDDNVDLAVLDDADAVAEIAGVDQGSTPGLLTETG